MIDKIGVIYEDVRSRGFLEGLRDRLRCRAELILPPAAIGRSAHLTKRTARLAWEYFRKKGVDLVIRFVDADRRRWQDVQRSGRDLFPIDGQSIYLCGVAVQNVEDWLALDRSYAETELGIDAGSLEDAAARCGRIKDAIDRQVKDDRPRSDVVAAIVRECPTDIFKQWLKQDVSLRNFYQACRQAATRAGCDTPNELEMNP